MTLTEALDEAVKLLKNEIGTAARVGVASIYNKGLSTKFCIVKLNENGKDGYRISHIVTQAQLADRDGSRKSLMDGTNHDFFVRLG